MARLEERRWRGEASRSRPFFYAGGSYVGFLETVGALLVLGLAVQLALAVMADDDDGGNNDDD